MFIDEHFDETRSIMFNSGRELGSEINKLFPHIPMILFTGTDISISKVVDIITKVGFSYFTTKYPLEEAIKNESLEKVLKDIFDLATVKSKWKMQDKLRSEFFLDFVKMKGIKFYENLLTKAKSNYDWSNEMEYSFKGIKINVNNFFRNRDDKKDQVSYTNNIKIVALLQKNKPTDRFTTIFKGDWDKNNILINCLSDYYQLPIEEYIDALNTINRTALNYLLDVLRVVNLLSKGQDQEVHYLSNKWRKLSVTASLKNDKLRKKNFYHKLVGRRVAIACSELLGLDGECLSKEELAVILRNGNTNLSKVKSLSDLISQVITTHLGLSSERQKKAINTYENYILDEELIWYSLISNYIMDVRAFLDNISQVIPASFVVNYGMKESYIDIDDFQTFMLNSAKTFPDRFDDLYDTIEREADKQLNSTGKQIIFREIDWSIT